MVKFFFADHKLSLCLLCREVDEEDWTITLAGIRDCSSLGSDSTECTLSILSDNAIGVTNACVLSGIKSISSFEELLLLSVLWTYFVSSSNLTWSSRLSEGDAPSSSTATWAWVDIPGSALPPSEVWISGSMFTLSWLPWI